METKGLKKGVEPKPRIRGEKMLLFLLKTCCADILALSTTSSQLHLHTQAVRWELVLVTERQMEKQT